VSNNTSANKVVAAVLPSVAPLVESQKQEPVKPSDKAVVKKVTIKHKVVRGENLTKLAAQYQVSLSALRDLNNLQDDNVKIGQVLKIPTH
jgi:LysM repeat protein